MVSESGCKPSLCFRWAVQTSRKALSKAYDLAVDRNPSDKIAVIAIDKTSLDNIGRWPWSREVQADMIDKLVAAKAKVVATTIFYSEPQRDPGLAYINRLIELYGQAGGVPFTSPDVTPEIVAGTVGYARHLWSSIARGRNTLMPIASWRPR